MLVFIALIIAGDLFGLLGLVLAIPVLAVIKVLIRFLDELYLRSDFFLAPATATRDGETTAAQRAVAATVSTARRRLTLALWQGANRPRLRSHRRGNLIRWYLPVLAAERVSSRSARADRRIPHSSLNRGLRGLG